MGNVLQPIEPVITKLCVATMYGQFKQFAKSELCSSFQKGLGTVKGKLETASSYKISNQFLQ